MAKQFNPYKLSTIKSGKVIAWETNVDGTLRMTTKVQQPQQITSNLFAVQECLRVDGIEEKWRENLPEWAKYEPGAEVHSALTLYILKGEKNLIFDTGTRANPHVTIKQVKSIIGQEDLDYLVLSHGEAPHAGNTKKILETFPETTLVTADHLSPEHDMFKTDGAMLVNPGDMIDLGNLKLEIVDPFFPDTSMTIWMYEETNGILFTVDWLGAPHTDLECRKTAEELDGESEITVERLIEFNGRALPWIEYGDPDKMKGVVDYIMKEYDPNIIAPAHGFVLENNIEEYMDKMKIAMERIAEGGGVGGFFG